MKVLELSAECKAKFRRLLQFFPRYRESALSTSPRWSTRARVSLPLGPRKNQVLTTMILCHSGAVDPSRPLTNFSRVTNKISTVITELPTPPNRLGDADHQV